MSWVVRSVSRRSADGTGGLAYALPPVSRILGTVAGRVGWRGYGSRFFIVVGLLLPKGCVAFVDALIALNRHPDFWPLQLVAYTLLECLLLYLILLVFESGGLEILAVDFCAGSFSSKLGPARCTPERSMSGVADA